jgi:hypothetical protein
MHGLAPRIPIKKAQLSAWVVGMAGTSPATMEAVHFNNQVSGALTKAAQRRRATKSH